MKKRNKVYRRGYKEGRWVCDRCGKRYRYEPPRRADWMAYLCDPPLCDGAVQWIQAAKPEGDKSMARVLREMIGWSDLSRGKSTEIDRFQGEDD